VRVAAIHDLHGNLPVLEAVLHEMAQTDAELVVVGGDVVAGPSHVIHSLQLAITLRSAGESLTGSLPASAQIIVVDDGSAQRRSYHPD
jgi:predicted phosphodiesterase